MRILLLWACCSTALYGQDRPRFHTGPVAVRYSEGTTHGFLEVRADTDSVIGYGDLLQVPKDKYVESRLILAFHDGSRFEETTRFTQHQVFRVLYYRLVQRGPAFAADLDATLESSGKWIVRTKSHKDAESDSSSGQLELPEDFANGLPVVLAKNVRPGDTAEVHVVAFTPKPRLIGLQIATAGRDSLRYGGSHLAYAHFLVKPRLGGLTKFFAKVLGKLPPDSELWIATDDVPAFLRFRGPMYSGPVWQLALTAPKWPR
jgi:hypothetical protein